MKKILSLLGSLSLLTTTSSTVIACMSGNGENETDNSSEILKLIEEFKVDLQLITNDYWELQNDRFFEVVDDSNPTYAFLNQETITAIVDNNDGQVVKGDVLSDTEKQSLTSDIDRILQLDLMKKEFESSIDHEKYALIIEDMRFFDGITPDWDSLELNYINNSTSENNFTSYVSLNLNLNFTYFDSNSMPTDYSLTQRFIFTLTSDETLINSILDLEKNFASDYYLKGGEYSWLDKNHFNYDLNEQLANIFKPTNKDFEEIYKFNSDFSNDIIEFIKTNYFVNMNSAPIAFSPDLKVFDQFGTIDYMNSLDNERNLNWATDFEKGLYNAIFSDLTHDGTALLFGKDETQINTHVYAYLKDEYKNFYKSFNEKNEIWLAKLESESNLKLVEEKKTAFDNSIRTGKVKIQGLTIGITEEYYHPINDITFFVSIAVSNDETKEKREDFNQSHLFGAMYHNLELGIQTFQDVFDIQPRDQKNDDELPIARFSGNGIASSGKADNIWNIIQVSGDRGARALSDSLSFNYYHREKYKNTILDEGKQDVYEWIYAKRNVTNSIFEITDKGIMIKKIYDSGDETLTWSFKLNFINASFEIPDIWFSLNKIVIERV